MGLCNAFTVDVEDYYHVSAFEAQVERSRWPEYESRVAANTRRLLDLLEEHRVRATFFVLGWVARHHQELIREIHQRGHEIGSHGHWHRLVYEQTPEEFRKDLVESRDAIECATGQRVVAYRAPSFSITRRSLWALDILAEEGFQLDSSIFPVRHDRYGMPAARREVHRIETNGGSIWEFPMAVSRFMGMNVPVSGGGYFRLYPLTLTMHWLRRINEKLRQPFAFYVHPWELDAQQPRLRAGSLVARARHYVNLGATERKLDHVLRHFRFDTLSTALAEHIEGTPSLQGTSNLIKDLA